MAFRVGQKVVCVDASATGVTPRRGLFFELKLNAIYTIAWVGIHDGELSVRLLEIPVRKTFPGHLCREPSDFPFYARRFRPVVSTDTGMSILESIRRDASNGVQRKIREDA